MVLSNPTEFLPWVEKYRPQNLKSVISHSALLYTIQRFIKNKQLPHLLFHGPPGTGKTSVAQAVSRELYGENIRHATLELNASDDRGIQVVRDIIKQFAETRPSKSYKYSKPSDTEVLSTEQPDEENSTTPYVKLIILDEADQMVPAAQMALRRIIEMYASHVRFLIICNYVNKIIPAIQSRCTKFRFPPLNAEALRCRTQQICKLENLQITNDALDTLLRIGCGDFRKILNCLQSSAMGRESKIIDEACILDTVGRPSRLDLATLLPHLTKRSFQECVQLFEMLIKKKGFALDDLVTEIYDKMIQYPLPISTTCILYPHLAEVQYRLCRGADDFVEVMDIIALFMKIRCDIVNVMLNETKKESVE